jgi:hypothetical protein
MSLGIFTPCYGDDYARWVPAWSRAMAAMVPQPEQVVMIGDEVAQEAWRQAGEVGAFILAPEHGAPFRQVRAYNHAIQEALTAQWLMHIGVDDRPVPGLYAQLRPLMGHLDVIAVDNGAYRRGQRRGGRRNRPTSWLVMQERTSREPVNACAAFRRSLWEQWPYDEEYEGGSDIALWIKFAANGARFGWTGQEGVEVEMHPGSLWHSRPEAKKREVKRRLNGLRRSYRQ